MRRRGPLSTALGGLAVAAIAAVGGPVAASSTAASASRATGAAAAAASTGGAVTMDPTAGPAGTTIAIASGQSEPCLHFSINTHQPVWPGQVHVLFGHSVGDLDNPVGLPRFQTLASTTLIADPDGSWATELTVPPGTAPGSYDVAVACFLPWLPPSWATTTTTTAATSTTTATTAPPTLRTSSTVVGAVAPSPRTLDTWIHYDLGTFTVTASAAAGTGEATPATPATPVPANAAFTG